MVESVRIVWVHEENGRRVADEANLEQEEVDHELDGVRKVFNKKGIWLSGRMRGAC